MRRIGSVTGRRGSRFWLIALVTLSAVAMVLTGCTSKPAAPAPQVIAEKGRSI